MVVLITSCSSMLYVGAAAKLRVLVLPTNRYLWQPACDPQITSHNHHPNRRHPNRRPSGRHPNRRSSSMAAGAEAAAEPRLDSSSRSRRRPNQRYPNRRRPNRRRPKGRDCPSHPRTQDRSHLPRRWWERRRQRM
jgi:hypothetical protein